MYTTHGERRLTRIRCQKECLESKLDGQTDSHNDYSAYLRVVHWWCNAAFHLDLQSKKYDIVLEIITRDSSIYTIDHTDLTVSYFIEHSIGPKKVCVPCLILVLSCSMFGNYQAEEEKGYKTNHAQLNRAKQIQHLSVYKQEKYFLQHLVWMSSSNFMFGWVELEFFLLPQGIVTLLCVFDKDVRVCVRAWVRARNCVFVWSSFLSSW